MEAAWAPAYAWLNVGLLEDEEVFTSPMYRNHVHTWLGYIDDVLLFIGQLNNNERNIRLMYTFDR